LGSEPSPLRDKVVLDADYYEKLEEELKELKAENERMNTV